MLLVLLANLATTGLLYASARHQRLLPRPCSAWLALPGALALLTFAIVRASESYDVATALLTSGALQMAALTTLPLAAAYIRRREPRS